MYGGPVLNAPSGSRYHLPLYVIRSIACSTLRTSHGLNAGIILASCFLSHTSNIIESRLHSKSTKEETDWSYGYDLFGVMIGAAKSNAGPKWNMKEILDECKTFFFTGHETTSNLLTWTVFLLSVHSEWQEKLREEVLQNCGMEIPNADMLSKLKLVRISYNS
ncbi:hypothetical protein L6164_002392 [Bauhinia variegata]|uniref:Uncharacterized protein n=1 Tax=Bauhinia variegata TaxID=167791 RepID=A0ACB9PY63_BAUVA|nr:hypothetical protein L6164_002392 [Bauhinia variegata]